jgi:hypothetical protein
MTRTRTRDSRGLVSPHQEGRERAQAHGAQPQGLITHAIKAYCQDTDSKFRLILIESRVHRLARYYKRTRVLPPNWKYESSTASALVS